MGFFFSSKDSKPALPPRPSTTNNTSFRPEPPPRAATVGLPPQALAPPPPAAPHHPLYAQQQQQQHHYPAANYSQPHIRPAAPAGYLPAPLPLPPPGWVPGWAPGWAPAPQQQPVGINTGPSPSLHDEIYSRFDNALTMIDRESHPESTTTRSPKKPSKDHHPGHASFVSGHHFSKVELYANSRLPADLPPLAFYMPTWPILCLAAQYSLRVYDPIPSSSSHSHSHSSSHSSSSPSLSYPSPSSSSSELTRRDTHIFTTGWRTNHKALLIKSIPLPHSRTILLSIRGTATFADWAVNMATSPTPPEAFLDDPGNLCHSGFLSLARNLVKPIAARLRDLLEQDPERMSSYSLLLTGHSAGGAVAALLYAHMLSTSPEAESQLSILAGCFKTIHCVTFGAPPVSLLPLEKPARPELHESLFLSFVNEGDPVARAEKPYVKSLLELLASPPPPPNTIPKPSWDVPPSTLSNAGRIIVLRSAEPDDPNAKPPDHSKTVAAHLAEGVVAATCRDDQLRGVIWSDPVFHMMGLYAGRIEALTVEAVEAATAAAALKDGVTRGV